MSEDVTLMGHGILLTIEHPDFARHPTVPPSEEHEKPEATAAAAFIERMASGWANAMDSQGLTSRLRLVQNEGPHPQLFFPYDEAGVEHAEKAVAFVQMSVCMGALSFMEPVIAYSFDVLRDVSWSEEHGVGGRPLTVLV